MKTKTTKTKTTTVGKWDEFMTRGAIDSLVDDLNGRQTVGPYWINKGINKATRQLAIGLKTGGFLVVTLPTYEGDDDQIPTARKVKALAGFTRLAGFDTPDNRPLTIQVTETKTYTIPAAFRAKVRRDLDTMTQQQFIDEHDELFGDIEEHFGHVSYNTVSARKVGK